MHPGTPQVKPFHCSCCVSCPGFSPALFSPGLLDNKSKEKQLWAWQPPLLSPWATRVSCWQGSCQVAARSQSHAMCPHPPGNRGREEEETGQAAHPKGLYHPNTACAPLLGSTGHTPRVPTGDSPQFSRCQQCPIMPEIQLLCRKVVALTEAMTLSNCGTRRMAADPAPASALSPFPSGFPPCQRCAQHPRPWGCPPHPQASDLCVQEQPGRRQACQPAVSWKRPESFPPEGQGGGCLNQSRGEAPPARLLSPTPGTHAHFSHLGCGWGCICSCSVPVPAAPVAARGALGTGAGENRISAWGCSSTGALGQAWLTPMGTRAPGWRRCLCHRSPSILCEQEWSSPPKEGFLPPWSPSPSSFSTIIV